MGSGKSAVGRRLAERLGLEFIDSDAEIESRTGVDIPYIFEREARRASGRASAKCSRPSRGATGCWWRRARRRPGSRHARAAAQPRLRRVPSGLGRAAAGPDPARRPAAAAAHAGSARHARAADAAAAPLYEETADLTVDTDGRRVAAVVEEIAAQLAAARGT